MKRQARKLPRALEDLYRQARYFVDEGSPDSAERFLAAAERAFSQLVTMPEMGARRSFRHRGLAGLRMWHIRGFREHVIFYRPVEDGVEVVRVLHAKRDVGRILKMER